MKISARKWSTKAVADYLLQVQKTGVISRYTPFHDKDVSLRARDLDFAYTEEEIIELAKIKANIFYFATEYCKVMTDDGIVKIKKLRDYQKKSLASFIKFRKNIWLASRQIGKCLSAFSNVTLKIFDNNISLPNFPIFELYYRYKLKQNGKYQIYHQFKYWLLCQQHKLYKRIHQ